MAVKRQETPLVPQVIFLAAVFTAGAVIGSFFAANISQGAEQYIESYVSMGTGSLGAAKNTLYADIALLSLIFLSAFFRWGMLLISAAIGAKGFFLSATVTAFVRTFGMRGYLAAFSVIFISGFLSVTFLLILSVQAMKQIGRRKSLRGSRRPVFPERVYFISAGICALAVMLSALLHVWTTPALSRTALELMR